MTKSWADRDDEVMNYDAEMLMTSSAEAEKGIKLFKVAENTEKFQGCHFSSAASNQTRRQCMDKYGAPNTPVMAYPTMDKIIKGRLSAVTKPI